MYLTAIIDLHSRYVVNWSVSNTMDAQWRKETLEKAIAIHGKPEIINTDQGSQFTSEVFTTYLNPLESGIDLFRQLENYFTWYNTQRRHQGIDNDIPAEKY